MALADILSHSKDIILEGIEMYQENVNDLPIGFTEEINDIVNRINQLDSKLLSISFDSDEEISKVNWRYIKNY